MRRLLVLMLLSGCGEASEDADAGAVDGSPEPDAAAESTLTPNADLCSQTVYDTLLEGPYTCASAPETVMITVGDRSVEIFKYEASHPLSTADKAFPCAVSQGPDFRVPKQATDACSTAGVRPWHTVRWADASAACTQIGWRLCSGEELLLACAGDADAAYSWGAGFEGGKCNFREGYRPEGAEFPSAAPSGHFEECVSDLGVHDANGNVWEWTDDRDPLDAEARAFQGAGWKTVAERHRDNDLVCSVATRLRRFSAPTYAAPDVGFRCCR